MIFRSLVAVATVSAVLPLIATGAHAASLSSLIPGGTLVQGGITFSDFKFDDRFGTDTTGGLADREDPALPGDSSIDASEITLSTSATASTVTLTATIAPGVSISDQTGDFAHIFDAFFDFTITVTGIGSTVTFDSVTLGAGDLFATGTGVSEVIFDVAGLGGFSDLEIFESPALVPGSATSDTFALGSATTLDFSGQIEGDTRNGDTAGLSTFSLTFNLNGTVAPPPPPPPSVVPVPAGLPLLLTGLIGLGLMRRARRS